MESSLGSWGTAFNGLPSYKPPEKVSTTRVKHLTGEGYKAAKVIIAREFLKNTPVISVKRLLDKAGLVMPEVAALRFIKVQFRELRYDIDGTPSRGRTPGATRKLIIAAVEKCLLAGMNNVEIRTELTKLRLDIHCSPNAIDNICSVTRKRLNLPRAEYTRKKEKPVSAIDYQKQLINFWTNRCRELLQTRANLSREDLEYVVEKVAGMKDDRLKECIATLVGWGDDERAELETFVAISLEMMKQASPYKLRVAATNVELRYRVNKNGD